MGLVYSTGKGTGLGVPEPFVFSTELGSKPVYGCIERNPTPAKVPMTKGN